MVETIDQSRAGARRADMGRREGVGRPRRCSSEEKLGG
jgi:hypothetical protein